MDTVTVLYYRKELKQTYKVVQILPGLICM